MLRHRLHFSKTVSFFISCAVPPAGKAAAAPSLLPGQPPPAQIPSCQSKTNEVKPCPTCWNVAACSTPTASGVRSRSTLGAIRRWYLSSCRPFTSTAIPIRWKKAAPISLLCCASSRASIPRRPPWLSKTRPFFSTRKKCRWKTAPIFWPTSWGLKPMTNAPAR